MSEMPTNISDALVKDILDLGKRKYPHVSAGDVLEVFTWIMGTTIRQIATSDAHEQLLAREVFDRLRAWLDEHSGALQ